jgi:hypothetical protein
MTKQVLWAKVQVPVERQANAAMPKAPKGQAFGGDLGQGRATALLLAEVLARAATDAGVVSVVATGGISICNQTKPYDAMCSCCRIPNTCLNMLKC